VGWIVLVVVGFGLCALVAWTLVRMAHDSDRAARRAHRTLDPFAEITITKGS